MFPVPNIVRAYHNVAIGECYTSMIEAARNHLPVTMTKAAGELIMHEAAWVRQEVHNKSKDLATDRVKTLFPGLDDSDKKGLALILEGLFSATTLEARFLMAIGYVGEVTRVLRRAIVDTSEEKLSWSRTLLWSGSEGLVTTYLHYSLLHIIANVVTVAKTVRKESSPIKMSEKKLKDRVRVVFERILHERMMSS